MKLVNLFKKKRNWFVVCGYLFNRDMLKRVTLIEPVEQVEDRMLWIVPINFIDGPFSGKDLTFSKKESAEYAYDLLYMYVREVQGA